MTTRFAPSPTGYLHIGSARTALFNWLLARKHGGRMLLRIEDTDTHRNVPGGVEKILQDLAWLGIDFDGEPVFQSRRLDLYRQACQRLVQMGRAYPCFETREQLQQMRELAQRQRRAFRYPRPRPLPTEQDAQRARDDGKPVVYRFVLPQGRITVDDLIQGHVSYDADELSDPIILKADGSPTFHLANVVDDHDMGITLVIRGKDHLANTPLHLAMYEAFGWVAPAYAHMPLTFNPDGSKISKRDKAKGLEVDVHDFRIAGYMPEALLNFIVLLGWSPGDNREIMSMDEIMQAFSLERVGRQDAKFDRDKLRAFNTVYIRDADFERLMVVVRQFLDVTDYPLKAADEQTLRMIVAAYQPRSRTLVEMAENSRFFLVEQIDYDPKAVRKVLQKNGGVGLKMLAEVAGVLADLPQWNEPSVKMAIEDFAARHKLPLGQVAQPVRVAVSGGSVSPPIDQTLVILGKERTLTRIRRCLQLYGRSDD